MTVRKYTPHDDSFESFLTDLNTTLALGMGDFAPPLSPFITGQIVGLPRSGTTILYQLLALTGRVGYPSNIMALFWRTPTIGARLHQHLAQTGPTIGVESIAGRTVEPLDPHEFGYFWRDAMGHSSNSIEADREAVEMSVLQDTLDAITGVFAAPVVYKNFYALVHIDKMRQQLKRQKVIVITRDSLDVALSLFNVRRKIGIPDGENFGLAVREPDDRISVHQRIATQVLTLSELQSSCGFDDDPDALVISYTALCSDPVGAIGDVLQFLGADKSNGWSDRLPRSLSPATPSNSADSTDARKLARLLTRGLE